MTIELGLGYVAAKLIEFSIWGAVALRWYLKRRATQMQINRRLGIK